MTQHSTKPVWMEEWTEAPLGGRDQDGELTPDLWSCVVRRKPDSARGLDAVRQSNRLAAAAPALVRALLLAEHPANGEKGIMGVRAEECPYCLATFDAADTDDRHVSDCPLDAALTLAGFPDQASRNAARKTIRGAR